MGQPIKVELATYATFSGGTDAEQLAVYEVPIDEWEQSTRAGRTETAAQIAASDLYATKCGSKATSYSWCLSVDGVHYAAGKQELTPIADPYDVMR